MEKRKRGYCNLTKLRILRRDVATKLQVEEEIIAPSNIKDEIKKNFYQNLFNEQKVKEGIEKIYEFFKLDNDDNPYQEFLNMTISDELRDSMEGNVQIQIVGGSHLAKG